MTMSDVSIAVVQAVLLVLVALLIPCVYRVLVGPTSADRLQALEVTTSLLIGIVVVLMLVQQSTFVLDIGIALAAFSFIATLGMARYLAEGRIF
jgi:multicomponent Na+:H+ antiporter subunit F